MRWIGSTLGRVGLCACAALALGAGAARAATPIHSPLPGYPRFRGVLLVHGSTPGIQARSRAIESALRNAGSGTAPSRNAESSTSPECATSNPGADLCWGGGPVVGAHRVHLIFWEGATAFPSGYVNAVKTYFESVAAEHGESAGDVYSVTTQYGGSNGPGAYQVSFTPASDVDLTTDALPASGSAGEERCEDTAPAVTVAGKCITDKQLQAEVTHRIATNGKGWTASLHDIFLVFMPPGVGSCFEPGSDAAGNACAFSENGAGYCAYHSNLGAGPTLYASLPDNGNVRGCDAGEHPNGAGGVDATLDTASHEHAETITDPLEAEAGWRDLIGQEVGDKCLPPETFDIYGGELGGSLLGGTAFNQLINGHHYWLQTEWSNAAGELQGGCVQRMVNTAFAPPSAPQATVPAKFDGSASGTAGALLAGGDPILYWEWDFGDEELGGEFFSISASPAVSHTYALPGTYRVTLTAIDLFGSSNTTSHTIAVGQAPPPPPPPPSPPVQTSTVTVTTLTPPPIHLTAAELATMLGLPPSGATLPGLGAIALGHAECPPACGVTLSLYATSHTTRHGHRVARRVPIGTLSTTIASRGTGALALKLNAAGRALLRRSHRLRVVLKIAVEDQQGATWQLSRPLTLTASANTAARRTH